MSITNSESLIQSLINKVINLGSSKKIVSITPSDDQNIHQVRAIYVGGDGNLAIRDSDGNDNTFSSVPAGTTLSISPRKVLSTGTTATNILGLV